MFVNSLVLSAEWESYVERQMQAVKKKVKFK